MQRTTTNGLITVELPRDEGWSTESVSDVVQGDTRTTMIKCKHAGPLLFLIAKDYTVARQHIVAPETLLRNVYPPSYAKTFTEVTIEALQEKPVGGRSWWEASYRFVHPRMGTIIKRERVTCIDDHVLLVSGEGVPEQVDAHSGTIANWMDGASFAGARSGSAEHRLLRIDFQDGIALTSGVVHAAPYRCIAFCSVPASWLEGDRLSADKIERFLEQIYGAAWRQGNSDGSRYVLQRFDVHVLSSADRAARPWLAFDPGDPSVRAFHYRVDDSGGFAKVTPTDLVPDAPSGPAPSAATAVLDVLLQFSRGEASRERVLRALIEHDRWLAPTSVAPRPDGAGLRKFSDDVNVPPRLLLLFTDLAHTTPALGAGAHLGAYAEDVSGIALFSSLDAALHDRVNVNPNCPVEETFFIDVDAFGQLALWAKAISTEGHLAAVAGGGLSPLIARFAYARIREFPGYQTLVDRAQGNAFTLRDRPNMSRAAVVFTTPDATESFLAPVPAEVAATLQTVTVAGDRLFPFLVAQGVDGAVVNAAGPGAALVLTSEHCRGVATP